MLNCDRIIYDDSHLTNAAKSLLFSKIYTSHLSLPLTSLNFCMGSLRFMFTRTMSDIVFIMLIEVS